MIPPGHCLCWYLFSVLQELNIAPGVTRTSFYSCGQSLHHGGDLGAIQRCPDSVPDSILQPVWSQDRGVSTPSNAKAYRLLEFTTAVPACRMKKAGVICAALVNCCAHASCAMIPSVSKRSEKIMHGCSASFTTQAALPFRGSKCCFGPGPTSSLWLDYHTQPCCGSGGSVRTCACCFIAEVEML